MKKRMTIWETTYKAVCVPITKDRAVAEQWRANGYEVIEYSTAVDLQEGSDDYTYIDSKGCCYKSPCEHPGEGPCEMPAHRSKPAHTMADSRYCQRARWDGKIDYSMGYPRPICTVCGVRKGAPCKGVRD